MEEELEIILRAVDEASDTFEGVSDSVSDMASSFEDVSGSTSEASEGMDSVADSGEGASDSMDSMTAAADAFTATTLLDFAQQVSDTLWNLADSAGQVQDSMDRASLEAEGFGLSAGEMKGVLGDVADETGRAGGQIRETFIKATARGVTDMDAFKSMMKGAGAQAYLLGTDIQTMGNKFSSMAQKDTLMSRALAETGITMDELGRAMGMTGATADEVKEKWKSLDTNQRAALLGTAASMHEGENANEHYKNSWEGLQAQVDKAKAKLEVMVGKVLLPVLIPALQVASRVLDWFGNVLGSIMDGPLSGLVSVLGGFGAAIAIAVPAIAAITAALGFFSATIWPAVTASWALLAPWLPWIALGAAIVLIIYEIGKAFDWWTDASSMIDAIGAGLQEMWSAFINHPDVQAAITAITGALQWLWGAIQNAGHAILEFFGVADSGKFDILHTLIDGIGNAWDTLKTIIMTVVGVFIAAGEAGNATADAFGNFWNGTLVPFGEWLSGIFAPVWGLIGDLINAVSPYITALSSAFSSFASGQMNLPTLIWTVLTTLFNAYVTIFSMIISRVASWGRSILARGVAAASSFVNGIINRIRSLPGQVYNWLMNVVGRITSAISAWISAASSKVHGVISAITSPFSGVASAISGALSGVVSAITAPFQAAWDAIKPIVDNIKNAMSIVPGLGGGASGGDHPMGDETAVAYGGFSVDSSPVVVEHNLNVSFDFKDVPSHISTEQLSKALTDRNVLRELTNNRDFQLLDGQAKERLNLKIRRANGA